MTKKSMLIISLVAFVAAGTFFVAGRTRAAGDLTPREARKLMASMAGIELPSDAVRVKEISTAGNSAIVVARVETAFRLVKGDKDKWRVAEIRTGDRRWEDLDTLMKALNVEKTARARAELESIATRSRIISPRARLLSRIQERSRANRSSQPALPSNHPRRSLASAL